MKSENPFGADNQQERPVTAQWVVGFVDGEGCFSVPIFRNHTYRLGWQAQPSFTVVQSARSLSAMHSLEQYFGCGVVGRNKRQDNHREDLYFFRVVKRSDLSKCIIPFFEVNPLVTAKQIEFAKFAEVVRMMEQGIHLSVDGLSQIAAISQTMNRRKPSRFLESSEAIRQPSQYDN